MRRDLTQRRRVAWRKDDPFGVEFAEIDLDEDRMTARGHAIGTLPSPYLLEFQLETDDRFVTARLNATTTGEGWRRGLSLERDPSGRWTASDDFDGEIPFEIGVHQLEALTDAQDCDLGLSPVTNTMPVLRHRLLRRSRSVDLVMAWVSVPDLVVHPERQRFTSEPEVRPNVVRFESLEDDFTADIVFDDDGVVLDYPGIARRL